MPLDSLHVRTGGDSQAGRSMPKFVRRQTMQSGVVGSTIEHIPAEVEIPQRLAAPRCEDQIATC